MRFLADESSDLRVARALSAAGHDVVSVADTVPGADDEVVIDLAAREERILLTEDRDFGQLVYASHMPGAGVIFIRFPASLRSLLPGTIIRLVEDHGAKLRDAFVVVQPGRVRIGGRPRT
jgi:hypothetical protein